MSDVIRVKGDYKLLEALGAVDLAKEEEPEVVTENDPLSKLGIVNRETARRAGLRNPRRARTMKVPQGKRRRPR